MEILSLILGFALGIIIAVVVYIMQDHARYMQQQAHEQQLQESRERYERQWQESSEWYSRQWQESRERYERKLQENSEWYEKQISYLKAEHARQLTAEQQRREKELAAEMTLVKEQMQNATADILKHRSEELSSANREQIGQIVNPLNEQLRLMKEAVDKNKLTQAETTSALRAQIEEMMRQTTQIGTKADNLARALTSENKTQGNFGEVRLVELLENMGLEKGIHFDVQETLRDDEGRAVLSDEGSRMIPDVILHFTDGRDAIIDSKMSIRAFERYVNAETEEERSVALKEHIKSVRAHVDELSHKRYDKYIKKGRQGLDYVLMYMFSESALQLALTADTTLWKYAFDRGVFITGSQNLYAILRLTKESWVQVEQSRNQEEIMKCADNIVRRVQLFAQRFKRLGELIDEVQDKYRDVQTTTAESGQSIIVAARRLTMLGAKEDKSRTAKALPESELFMEEEKLEPPSYPPKGG